MRYLPPLTDDEADFIQMALHTCLNDHLQGQDEEHHPDDYEGLKSGELFCRDLLKKLFGTDEEATYRSTSTE